MTDTRYKRIEEDDEDCKYSLQWIDIPFHDTSLYQDKLREKCLTSMSKIDNIGNNRWHFYRKLLNKYDFNSRKTAVNRAFYKLWEILSKNQERRIFAEKAEKTLHIAEAPGSFLQVIKKLNVQCFSIGVSKPPSTYADVVRKSRTIPLFDNTVTKLENVQLLYRDLLSTENLRNLVYEITQSDEGKKFDLITADGGFDEEERYDAKETLHFNLILNEIICILLTQKKNGMCVLKVFETFTATTIHLLWLLCSHYTDFEIIKPDTSRPTNAERYVVCSGFKGTSIHPENFYKITEMNLNETSKKILNQDIPKSFLDTVLFLSEYLTKKQINAIESVVTFVKKEHENDGKNNKFKKIDKKSFIDSKSSCFTQWSSENDFLDNILK